MRNGKYQCKKSGFNIRPIAAMLAVALLIGCGIGGTIAWLTDTSDDVVNTFTVGDVEVGLEETTGTEYKMIPGWTIDKDPEAWVTADSEDCYLFIKVVEDKGVVTYTPAGSKTPVTTKWSDFLSYEIADGWTKLTSASTGGTAVYYRIFEANLEAGEESNGNVKGTEYPILKNDKVSVNPDVTKEMMDAVTEDTRPTLTFTAYAVQLDNTNTTEFTAEAAWDLVKN